MTDVDPPQGPIEIQRAAIETVIRYLDNITESPEFDAIWSNHPLLLDWEVRRAGDQACDIVVDIRELLRTMTPKVPATPSEPDQVIAALLLQGHNDSAPGDLT